MKKECSLCKTEKDLSNFHKNGFSISGEQRWKSWCKECTSKETKKKRKDIIVNCLEILNIEYRCNDCGYNKNTATLCFHHIEPETKSFRISRNTIMPVDKLLNEIQKCKILCANCHMEHHNPEYNI